MNEDISQLLKPNERIVSRLRYASFVGSLVTFLIGLLSILGWQLHITYLQQSFPLTAMMNPLSAVGFICLGGSLFLFLKEKGRKNYTHSFTFFSLLLINIVIASIGFLMMLYFLGISPIRVDQLLFSNSSSISLHSSTNLLLLGLALVLLQFFEKKYSTRIAQLLTLCTGLICMLSIIGYAYEAFSIYQVTSSPSIPLSSAITASIFALSLLAATSDHGITKIFTRNTPSSTLAFRLIVITLILPALLGYVLLFVQQTYYIGVSVEIALLVIGSIILLSIVLWINTRVLQNIELENLIIKKQLEQNNITLEINAKDLANKALSLEEENKVALDKLYTKNALQDISDNMD